MLTDRWNHVAHGDGNANKQRLAREERQHP